MNGDSRPWISSSSVVDVVDPGQALEQRALATAVAPDDPEELALRNVDADVLHGLEHVECPRPERMQRPLLERVVLLMREAEGLAEVADRHGRQLGRGAGAQIPRTLGADDGAHGRDGSNRGCGKRLLLCANLNVCTIIAKNYVAHARVLARSLTATHPGSRLSTLIIDDFVGWIDPAEEPFEILTPADVGCEEFTHMALRYSVLELSTAVKPWLLRHLMT